MRSTTPWVLLVAMLLAMLLPVGLQAQESGRPHVSITAENDVFVGTDRHYTNAIRFQFTRRKLPVEETPGWGKWLAERINRGKACEGACVVHRGWSVIHQIYTPEDLLEENLIINDRPYGGWLRYGSFFEVSSDRMSHLFHGSVGIIGELSGAEGIQRGIHELLNSDIPEGWDNQLENEPTLQLVYRYEYQPPELEIFADEDETLRVFDVLPYGTAALGNAFIYGGVGAVLRAGYNMSDNHSQVVAPSAAGGEQSTGWEIYAFVETEGRVMGRNIFLDGNTFTDSHSVDKETFVWDLQVGVSLRIRRWTLTYRTVARSREFDLQQGDQGYGSITLSIAPF